MCLEGAIVAQRSVARRTLTGLAAPRKIAVNLDICPRRYRCGLSDPDAMRLEEARGGRLD